MKDYKIEGKKLTIEANGAELNKVYEKIDTIVVSGNVDLTTVSDLSDKLSASVEKVVFCEGIKYIGTTFSYCKRLSKIEFPESLEEIGPQAFYGCTSLKEINIPKNVKDILDEAFANCTKLRTVNGDLFNILHINVFSNTRFASRLTENDMITYDGLILDGSLCSGNVVIPNGVREIVAGAFHNNTNLRSITIPEGVMVSHSAFKGCINLEEATLPADTSVISENLFLDCLKLKTIRFQENNIIKVYANAFTNTSWLEERVMDNNPFVLNGILVDGKSCKGEVKITGIKKIADEAFRDNLDLTGVTISDECESIGNRAFYYCNFLKTVKLPAGLMEMGNSAFCGCDHLEEICIPEHLETIPYNAFNYCLSLRSVHFPQALKKIQNWAFYKCNELKDYKIPEGTIVDPEAFATEPGRQIGKVVVAKAVKNHVKENSYKERADLCVAIVPEGVTFIESHAFYDCQNLRKVVLPKSLKTIESWAFGNCRKLETIDLPDGIERIEGEAFTNTALKKVVLPASLKKVAGWAFDQSNLLYVDIRCKKESIWNKNFYDRWNPNPSEDCKNDDNTQFANATPPIYWHIFSFLFLLAAGFGIWNHFAGAEKLTNAMALMCLILLPVGYLANKCCSKLGIWKNVAVKKPSKLGNLLYAPALVLPLAIIGYPLYHFLQLSIPLSFLISTAAIMLIVFVVDTCLNVYKERFVLFFQDLYEGSYKLLHNYVWTPLKNYVLLPFKNYILIPLKEHVLIPMVEKLLEGLEWLCKHVIKPIYNFFKRLAIPIWKFIKSVLAAITDFIRNILKWLVRNVINPLIENVIIPVLRPLWKLTRFIVVDIVFKYFLKYILMVIGSIIAISGSFFKVVFGWVLNDANGTVNYFITIPLIILSILGALFYFFFS